MLVKNNVSWAGPNFSYAPGDHIDLPEKVAKARMKAGLASEPELGAQIGDNTRALKAALTDTTAKLSVAEKRIETARADGAAEAEKRLGDEQASLLEAAAAEIASLKAYVAALIEQIEALGKKPVAAPKPPDTKTKK